jgi:50S ribosomal protein L16 3-hydroxylase
MTESINPLGKLSPDAFLKDYWQKQPLVVEQAFADFQSPITADELAGLACETDVNSKIVIEKDGRHPWEVVYGPMDESVFAQLPETHWTLLVNDVEKHLPELVRIIDQFRFIPEWRIDDLMISYAPAGGSVGPHMDQYDVFILQAQGHRRWQIHTREVDADNQVAGTDLCIQKDFVAEEEWLLGPGDLIYIPPGVSHYGVATDDCLSFSIGFRAASHTDMLHDFIEYISADSPGVLTYRDPDLKTRQHPNEITSDDLEIVRNIFRVYMRPDHPELSRWFGRFISDTRTDMAVGDEPGCASMEQLLAEQPVLARHPASHFAFSRDGDRALLFVDGNDYEVSPGFAEALCAQRKIDVPSMSGSMNDNETRLLLDLYNQGRLSRAESY